jgi:serine/threonine protein kinase
VSAGSNDWEDWFGLCGTQLEGKYNVHRVVGSGSYGVVYHAMETGLMPGPVAIKCLKVPLSLDERGKESFLLQLRHEGRLLRELSTRHAGITQARGAGTLTTPSGEWVPYLVLEWLSGDALETYMRKRAGRGLPLLEAVELLDQGARALAAANAAGVAHRDVKPANLFVLDDTRRLRTKVLDFGVAKAFDDHVPFEHDRTAPLSVPRTGAFTPAYGAP